MFYAFFDTMRVFITSTPDELELYQEAAVDIVRAIGHEPVLRDPAVRRGVDPMTACRRQIALADAVLAIVGWRRGRVPSATCGGDNLRPWSYWEVRSALKHSVPVVAFLAGKTFASEMQEHFPEARAVVSDLRGELARVAAVFNDEADFRRLVSTRLHETERASRNPPTTCIGAKLRRFPTPVPPPRPYPLLLPYTHPDFMAGRDSDLADLRRILGLPVTVVGLHAASGTGKSSFLGGGLIPMLRAEGRPVAYVRHPTEAGLEVSLLTDLVEAEEDVRAVDARDFVDRLVAIWQMAAGAPSVLVIDQFEDVLKADAERARAVLGPLLAASAQRLPGLDSPPCRWLLSYRQEYHGKLVEWLEDVIRDTRALDLADTEMLPHDLSGPSRFVAFSLPPLATPPPGVEDPVEAAARVFLDAIEKPLCRGTFPWAFATGHAERLAHAFAEARARRPDAPLVPELQVVLAHLVDQAGEPIDGYTPVTVKVPDDPAELIDRALEEHLVRALGLIFPHGCDKAARTRALLVLRELAGIQGRCGEGHLVDELERAFGEEARSVLKTLSTPRARLVLRERHSGVGRPDRWVYVLAHDRLAEVLIRAVDDGCWAGMGIDAELLGLRRYAALQSQLYASGDTEQATAMPLDYFRKIEANHAVLLWHDQHQAWWGACHQRWQARQRQVARRIVAAVVMAAMIFGAWMVASRRTQQRVLLTQIATAEPKVAFKALGELTHKKGYDRDELLDWLRKRKRPFDVFERGQGGVDAKFRVEALLRVADLTLPILEASPEDPVLIASLVWALDFFAARNSAFTERALVLRDEVLEPLRRSQPPPPRPEPGFAIDDPHWVIIPAGTFWMGARTEEGRDNNNMQDEYPRHQVTLSPFRMMNHEVTNAEYRRLFPDFEGDGELPAVRVTWYEAYTYAAWLGGRLPTEAEWEYAARAGCAHAYCKSDGSEATLDEIAWWAKNSIDPETGDPLVKTVKQLEPNPWGLWDIYGNVWEWNATWYGSYSETIKGDPPGPTDTLRADRTLRGGSAFQPQKWVWPSRRWAETPDIRSQDIGFRVVLSEFQNN